MKKILFLFYYLKLNYITFQNNFYYIDKTKNISEKEIPLYFDSRIKWPNCIDSIKDQSTCGACYAISASSAFSMRYCIRNNLNFSSQHLINCLNGCKGEFSDVVWNYLNKNGIPNEECEPYKNKQLKCLINKCENNNKNIKFFKSGKIKFLE